MSIYKQPIEWATILDIRPCNNVTVDVGPPGGHHSALVLFAHRSFGKRQRGAGQGCQHNQTRLRLGERISLLWSK